jgi:Peptidase family M1 domain/Peptidase M1 N-terminal domain
MKRFLSLAPLGLLPFCTVALAGPDPDHVHASLSSPDEVGFDEICGCGKAEMLRQRFLAGLPVNDFDGQSGGGYHAREAMTDTDVLSNLLDIEVIPSTTTITGSNTMTVRSRVNGLTQFTFVLRNNFTVNTTGAVDSVQLNGTTTAFATEPGTNSYARTVTLDRAYNLNETFTVRVGYSGVPVSRGFGSFDFANQDGVAGAPIIVESLSEPYYAATWWPCKDGDVFTAGDNSDKATMDISITAPSTNRSLSNGLLQSITPLSGGRSKYRWVTNYPTTTYLFFIASTQYNTYTQTYNYPLSGGGTGSMPVEIDLYPMDDTAANRNAWFNCLNMMAAYRPYYGEYPFVNEKYGIYEFNFGGGQEHQTFTGEGTFSESVTSHELGHQWWGDNITCKTWGDIWLNEGFATYTEALWIEHRPGSGGLPDYLAAMQARKPTNVADSVYVYAYGDINRIFSTNFTYRKGGWVLHQLRHLVGDTTFYNILQTYRAGFQGGGATTDDFAGVASSVSGQDLTWFFRQCVYGVGAPAYAIGTTPVTVNGQNYLRVSLRQTQDATWPGAGAPAGYFAFPTDLRVDTAGGSTTTKLNNNARTQWFVVPASAAVTGSALDEFNWILNTAKVAEAYQAGPPKIVQASPGPGSQINSGVPTTAAIVTFSEAVNAASAAFSVTGPSGNVPFTFAYNAGTFSVTLTFSQPLAPGSYTVTVQPTVTASSGGAQLDGEVPGTALVGQGPLPSGNGVAGGAASWSFTVGGTCGSADFNCDGDFGTDSDIEAFFACLAGVCPAPPCTNNADFNGDGDIGTDADIETFFRILGGGPC